MVDVTHLRPFYFDPNYVTPLNIAANDTNEYVVEMIVDHDFSDNNDKRWLLRWSETETPDDTRENYERLRMSKLSTITVQHFNSILFLLRSRCIFSASKANLARSPSSSLPLPVPIKQNQASTPPLPRKNEGVKENTQA